MDQMNPGMGTTQPEMGMDQAANTAGQGDYTICIQVSGGQLSVGVENEAAEAAAPGMPAEGEAAESAGFRPAGSIKEALTMALEIYRADGQMPEDGSQADAEFDSGFTRREPQ